MKIQSNRPSQPTPADTNQAATSNAEETTTRSASTNDVSRASADRASADRESADSSSTAADRSPSPARTDVRRESATRAAEQNLVSNYLRGKLVDAGRNARRDLANPADGAGVMQDPRQASLDTSVPGLPGLDRENPLDGLGVDPLAEAADRSNWNVGGKPQENGGRPDPLHGAFDPMEQFQDRLGSKIGERSSGSAGKEKDPNAQSDGDALTWGALTIAGLAGGLVSTPVGWAAGIGAAVVGGLNYVYDAVIEDMDNDVPDTVDHQAEADAKVESQENEGSPGGGDVSDDEEDQATIEYILDNITSPHPDDTSGDNPNPDPTPDLTQRPSVDPHDTVSNPADPYATEPTAEQLQQRIDAMQRFGPRTQNAINPGDHGGEVGGNPDAPLPEDLPGEDPVGDPGSPDGPNQPNA
ncbi:MAG: hypothetical protein R3E97_22655 [Candidatus Eisenbacteria bacterium]